MSSRGQMNDRRSNLWYAGCIIRQKADFARQESIRWLILGDDSLELSVVFLLLLKHQVLHGQDNRDH
jgi:hypothetical protein